MTAAALAGGASHFDGVVSERALRDLRDEEIDAVVGGHRYQIGPFAYMEITESNRTHINWMYDHVTINMTLYVAGSARWSGTNQAQVYCNNPFHNWGWS